MFGVSAAISCDNIIQTPDMYGCQPAPEYGVPVMEYRMSGKVVDSTSGEPIKGISVTHTNPEEPKDFPAAVYTSEDGAFVIEGNGLPSDKMLLKFDDVDGYENGGYFIPSTVEVKLKEEITGDGNWFSGVYIADDVLVRLDEDVPVEYGTPMVEFSVKGRVMDADSSPVENIEVSVTDYYNTVRTASDGTFVISGEIVGFEMEELSLKFTDTDGEANGGEFETAVRVVPVVQTDAGDGRWDNGDYQADNVEVILEKRK